MAYILTNHDFCERPVILDELGEVASGAALRDEEELHAARGDVPDGVENACKIGVRRELREGVQLACVEILEGLVVLPAYLKHIFTLLKTQTP